MLVSHESPISILEESKSYNDYDYALVHLFETQPEYYNFFKRSLLAGREVLLDNSIFELGEAFDSAKYIKYITELNPSFYIVPDVLQDAEATMSSWKKFFLNYGEDLNGRTAIGVVQGNSYQELVDCYKFMSDKADYIAFSFDLSMYDVTGYGKNRLERCVNGRHDCIRRLVEEGAWNYYKPHHLLGCALAREFRWYRENNIRGIRSLDTSNPVVSGIKGIRFNGNLGLTEKPSQKLFTMIKHEVTDDERELILYNAAKFREIVHGDVF